jgi:hypothetical protein
MSQAGPAAIGGDCFCLRRYTVAGSFNYGATMPMDFLRRIEQASFPLEIHEEADVHNAAVLAAAQLIEAVLPPPSSDPGNRGAVIVRITPLGRRELDRLRST